MGTMFQMNNSLTTTWQDLRPKHFHQIDQIDPKAVYCFTDHKLLITNCFFRIQSKKKGLKPPKKYHRKKKKSTIFPRRKKPGLWT